MGTRPAKSFSKTNNRNNKKNGGKSKSKNKGIGSSSSSAPPFDINASVIRLEKKYDELMRNAAKKLQMEEEDSYSSSISTTDDVFTREYIVTVRPSSSRRASIPDDWVPIANFALKRRRRPENSDYHEDDTASNEMVQTAISAYCRELSHVATVGAPVFATIPRSEIQYGVETIDSFHKYVYEDVVEGKSSRNPNESMSKAEARDVLCLSNEDGDDEKTPNTALNEITKSDIKRAYRKLSFQLHPDRFQDSTPEKCEEAQNRFRQVKLAYDTLSSGVRGEDGVSWYESLGGRERTEFVGPITLVPLTTAQKHMKRHEAEGALCGLNPDLVQSFVARHLRSA